MNRKSGSSKAAADKLVKSIRRKTRQPYSAEEGDKRLAGLKQLETKLTRKDAKQQLVQVNPDFHDIRQDQAFNEWVAMQPQNIQDSLYKNNTDARAAARTIDLYNSDTGKRKTNSKKSATQAVRRTSSFAPASTGKMKFSESQVATMSNTDNPS